MLELFLPERLSFKKMFSFLSLILFLTIQSGDLVITPLSFDAKPFRQAFNEAKDHPRLLGIYSPTCAHCLQTCSEIQEILEANPDADIKMFLLWAPFEVGDNLGHVRRAAETYLHDKRVRHYWDIWRYGSRTLSPELRVPAEQAWGIVALYPPGESWEEKPPEHEFWMQSRNLIVGTPYSQKGLERKLKKWF
jgi:hypothetical protein